MPRVDVVGVAAALVQLDQVADDRDEVFLRQDRVVRRELQPEAVVDLVAADAAQVVALGREEQPLERQAGGLEVRRLAGTQQAVDLLEGLGLVGGRVLAQGVLDERRLAAAAGEEHLDLRDARLAELLAQGVGDFLAALGEDLARVGVGDVGGEHVARFGALDRGGLVLVVTQVERGVAGEDGDRVDAGPAQRLEQVERQLVAFARQRVALAVFRIRHVGREHGAEDLAALLAGLEVAGDVELLLGVEELEDLRVAGVAEGAQQRGGRELLLLVDVDVDHVVDVEGELDPRAPERDDARAEQPLPVGVDGLLEHHARGAVQLADDDPLGAVDDERAQRREQRQLAEVDFLLEDVLGALLARGDFLEDDQPQRGLERRRVRHVALDALLDRVLRLADRVRHELERVVLVHVGDREQVAEDPVQADVGTLALGVQERVERAGLDIEEMRHRHPFAELAEGDDREMLCHFGPSM